MRRDYGRTLNPSAKAFNDRAVVLGAFLLLAAFWPFRPEEQSLDRATYSGLRSVEARLSADPEWSEDAVEFPDRSWMAAWRAGLIPTDSRALFQVLLPIPFREAAQGAPRLHQARLAGRAAPATRSQQGQRSAACFSTPRNDHAFQ